MNFHTALGTSLGAMVPISMVGVATHAKLGNVVPRIAAPLAAGTMLGIELWRTPHYDLIADEVSSVVHQ